MSESYYDPTALASISDFDKQFAAREPEFRPGPELLPDGVHQFEILSVALRKSSKSGTPIFAMVLRVAAGPIAGTLIERASVLTSQQAIDRLGGDLVTLGLDADQWTAANGRPFSGQLVANMGKLPGKRFVAQKKTNPNETDPSKPYHNLYINALAAGAPMPTTPAPAGFLAPSRAPAPALANSNDDPPF
jgi:hypothetical protein